MAWWRDDAVIHRFVCDVIAAELAALRPTSRSAPPPPWSATLHLVHDCGVDSLELVALASALTESIHLHESGIEDGLLVRATIGDWAAIAQAGLETYSATMTFRTSGSSDMPKRCEHTLVTLAQEIEELAPLVAGRRRVLSAVRSHHIYGFLFTVLLPRRFELHGATLIDVRNRSPSALRAELREGDLVVGYPDFWRMVARVAPVIPPGVVGVTSTAHCPDEIVRDLIHAGLDAMVQVYGSSETGGVGARTDPGQPYSLFSYWQRSTERPNEIVRHSPDGRRTSYSLQDHLEWTGDRAFRPSGRIDTGVQVAGVNVYAANVRRVLLEHPQVLDATVRRVHSDELSRLKAFIVPRDGRADLAVLHAELERWVDTRLSAPERPKAFSFGDALPVDASGKLTDWRIVPAADAEM